MDNRIRSGLAWAALGLGLACPTARGQQVIERDTKVTGPRGRTIERDIRVQRGPGYIDRQIEIKRPGETIIRDTRIATPTGRPFHPGSPFIGGGPRAYPGYGPRPIVEQFIVQRPPAFSAVVGLPALGFFFNNSPPPPPPVVVYPEPGVIYPPPAQGPPPQQVIDPLTEPLSQLKSFHAASRRDACLALGQAGDPRAVPPLAERLQHDFDKEVRAAAAWALGEIGDPGAGVPLERAVLHDKRAEVRDAANKAYHQLRKPGQVAQPTQAPTPQPTPTVRSQPEATDPGASPSRVLDDLPPPPPLPASPRDPS